MATGQKREVFARHCCTRCPPPSHRYFEQLQVKRVSYLSLEFLIGRAMQNALMNMDLEGNYRTALTELG